MSLFSESESSIRYLMPSLFKFLKSDKNIFQSIVNSIQPYDEPNYWSFTGTINSKFIENDGKQFLKKSSGFSFFDRDEAIAKCILEGIERCSNAVFRKEFVDYVGTYTDTDIKKQAIDIHSFAAFSRKQLKNESFKRFQISDSSKISWCYCTEINSNKKYLVPCQYIYLSYPFNNDEANLYPTISTGVAIGSSLSGALLRAAYEIIERDAYIIHYLNKLAGKNIDLYSIKDKRTRYLIKKANRYKIEIYSIDIRTDNDIPVVVSIVIDKTGIGKAVSVGLRADFDIIEAICGSLNEAFHNRGWSRHQYQLLGKRINAKKLLLESSVENRGLYWYETKMINKLDFWLNQKRVPINTNGHLTLETGKLLETLVSRIKSKGYNIYWKDITLPEFKSFSLYAVKVIIPEYQPIYLNENYPLLGGKRLYEIPVELGYKRRNEKQLNLIPHPFL